ncbi:unnamed protein product [Cylicocyclus nassatus]|uniref:Uncharacterized protein n=1 Tax=Cylicocyclus nassatus TaxID=53992 RepID=A0AA36GLU2_CYLNA|nr:unnamed protein product [Cylicocyclus nassatus]
MIRNSEGGWEMITDTICKKGRTYKRCDSRSRAEAIFTPDAELRAIRLKRVQEQLIDFDSDVSSISPPKRRKYTDREVNKFQMEVLKEEKALVAKKSLLSDRQLELLGEIKEMIGDYKSYAEKGK